MRFNECKKLLLSNKKNDEERKTPNNNTNFETQRPNKPQWKYANSKKRVKKNMMPVRQKQRYSLPVRNSFDILNLDNVENTERKDNQDN